MAGNHNSGRRKPVLLRAYEGNRSKVPLPEEPPTEAVAPTMPADLPPLSKPIWDWAVGVLGYAKLIQKRDQEMLSLACRHYAHWMAAEDLVAKMGLVLESVITQIDTNGMPVDRHSWKENPACRISAREAAAYKACLMELGLSPSAWVKLAAPKTKRETSLLDRAQ